MAYERVNWENLPSTKTPINRTNLNKTENGIKNNDINIGGENYDNTKTYEVGDIVRYNEKIYKCITAITTAENFDISKWEQTNIVEIVQSEKSKIYELIEAISTPIVGEGENITLNDTAEKRFEKFDIEGNSEQEATPSPDYPSEIKTVGSNGSVKVTKCNKNIMPILNLGNNYEYTGNGIKSLKRNNGVEVTRFKVRKGQTIKFGLKMISRPSKESSYTIYFKDKNNEIASFAHINDSSYIELNKVYEKSYTANEDGEIFIKLWGNDSSDIFEFQLWAELNTLTNYIQHEEQSYIMPTQQPFRAIGKIRDKFILKENGKRYERHYINRRIYDGTTNKFVRTSGTANNLFVTNKFEDGNIIVPSTYRENVQHFNNYFQTNYSSDELFANGQYVGSAIRPDDDMVMGFGKESKINTVDKANAWLKAKYDAGAPLYVDYLLETPIDIECTEEQSKILDELNNARTYKGVTHIYSNDAVSPNFYVEAVKDLTTLIQ